jgi:hypothetical protein
MHKLYVRRHVVLLSTAGFAILDLFTGPDAALFFLLQETQQL